MQLKIAREAVQDLADIWDAIAESDVQAADRVLRSLGVAMERLAEIPEMGRTRPELMAELRSWVVGKYLVFYGIVGDELRVYRVLHGRRDLDSLF